MDSPRGASRHHARTFTSFSEATHECFHRCRPAVSARPEPRPGDAAGFLLRRHRRQHLLRPAHVGLIAPDLGLSTAHASWIVSLTQLGYALGLLLLVPLADLLENRG
jgi:hypothetical protein